MYELSTWASVAPSAIVTVVESIPLRVLFGEQLGAIALVAGFIAQVLALLRRRPANCLARGKPVD